MKLALLIIFISFYRTDPNIKMGFELETGEIMVKEEIFVTDPVIEKDTYKTIH